MNAIYLLIPISIGFLLIAIVAFLWASRRRQFDDMDTPAHSILMDDERDRQPSASPVITCQVSAARAHPEKKQA